MMEPAFPCHLAVNDERHENPGPNPASHHRRRCSLELRSARPVSPGLRSDYAVRSCVPLDRAPFAGRCSQDRSCRSHCDERAPDRPSSLPNCAYRKLGRLRGRLRIPARTRARRCCSRGSSPFVTEAYALDRRTFQRPFRERFHELRCRRRGQPAELWRNLPLSVPTL